MRIHGLLLGAVLAASSAAQTSSCNAAQNTAQNTAKDKGAANGAREEKVTVRVLGLFDADREKDLRAAVQELQGIQFVAIHFDDAELTVAFDPAVAFPGVKPADVLEHLDQRLRAASRHTFGVKPRRTVARDKLEQVVIPVAGLDCKACALAAYEIVARIDGVWQATASFKDGRITALIDPTKTNKTALETALRQRGVQVGKP